VTKDQRQDLLIDSDRVKLQAFQDCAASIKETRIVAGIIDRELRRDIFSPDVCDVIYVITDSPDRYGPMRPSADAHSSHTSLRHPGLSVSRLVAFALESHGARVY